MEREKAGVLVIVTLPGHGPVRAHAAQHRSAIGAFCEFD
jgi:hypothetical protein